MNARFRHAHHYLALAQRFENDWQLLDHNIDQIQRAFEWVRDADGQTDMVLDFVSAMRVFQNNRGMWHEQIAWNQFALQEIQQTARADNVSSLLHNIGWCHHALGDRSLALDYLEQSYAAMTPQTSVSERAVAFNAIGVIYQALEHYDKALEYCHQALELRREINDGPGEALTLNNIGTIHNNLGEWHSAIAFFSQSLSLQNEVGESPQKATILNNTGAAQENLGHIQ